MRKIIAVLVVFALVVGAAFAETSISGTISARAFMLALNLDEDGYSGYSSGGIETIALVLSGENDEGTFGGLAKFRGNDGLGIFDRAFTWWKPIPQLEVFLGQDTDGKFAFYNPWSHHQGQEAWAHENDWGGWRKAMAFTNFDDFGLAITLRPIDGLAIDLAVPFGGIAVAKWNNWNTLYTGAANPDGNNGGTPPSWSGPYPEGIDLRNQWGGNLGLTASFAIPDIGTAYFGIKGPGNSIFIGDPGNYGKIGLAFRLGAVEGLDLLVGFSTTIPGKVEDYPVDIALMANYAAGDFGVKTRWRAELGSGSGATFNEDYFLLEFDVMPYYNLGVLTAFFNFGLKITDTGAANTDPVVKLVINPYIKMGLGAGSIQVGLLYVDPNIDVDGAAVASTNNAATVVVPVTFGFSF